MGNVMKKSILPMAFLVFWLFIMKSLYMVNGQPDFWRMWLLVGFPFGIRKMCLWLIPSRYDLGAAIGIMVLNILIGCLIGGFIAIVIIIRAVYVWIVYIFSSLLKIVRMMRRIAG